MFKPQRFRYDKPSTFRRVGQVIFAFFSTSHIKWLFQTIAYNQIHYVRGRKLANIGKSNIHPTAMIREGEFVTIGDNCLINHNCLIQAGKSENGRIKIGNYVHMGVNVVLLGFNHGFYTREIPTKEQDYMDAPIVVEDDVWIGAGSIILSGVTIGRGGNNRFGSGC